MSRTIEVAGDRNIKPELRWTAGHNAQGDFDLIVRVDGRQRLCMPMNAGTATDGHRLTVRVDLAPLAGRKVNIESVNQPSGWVYEAAYWGEIELANDPALDATAPQ